MTSKNLGFLFYFWQDVMSNNNWLKTDVEFYIGIFVGSFFITQLPSVAKQVNYQSNVRILVPIRTRITRVYLATKEIPYCARSHEPVV